MEQKEQQSKKNGRIVNGYIYGAIIMALSVLVLTIGVVAVAKNNELASYRQEVENQYNRAFHETVDYVRDIDSLLAKSMLVASPDQMATVSSEIFRQSMAAKANMGQLPISDVNIDNTAKFLSQAGDYAYALSQKMANDESITQEEFDQLAALSQYCDTLNDSLSDIQQQIYAGEVHFGELAASGHSGGQDASFVSNIEDVEREFQDYPTLMYDGPFSEHIEKMEAKNAPKDGADIGHEAAKQIAQQFLGDEKANNMVYNGDEGGVIPCYTFASQPDDSDRTCYVNVTRSGGHVLMYLDNRGVESESLDFTAATQKAQEFLQAKGYRSMKQSYYEKAGGIATINFAYVQDGVVMYPDLVKVKVALDNGEILGLEAKGYIMAHEDTRTLPQVQIPEQQAREKVNKNLQIQKGNLALIATDSYREVLCYELQGNFNGKNFIVYINAQTGREEKILMLIESEDGILTI